MNSSDNPTFAQSQRRLLLRILRCLPVLLTGVLVHDAFGVGMEITPRPWYRHYDRYNYGNDWKYGRPSDYDAYYNLKVGNLTLGLGGTTRLALRWSDNNNNASGDAAREGMSLVPEATLALNYPVSPYLTLESSVSFGYRWYPDDEAGESDYFLSTDSGSAATSVGGTLILGEDHLIKIHDRLTYESDTLSGDAYYSLTDDDDDTLDYDTWRNTLNATYVRQLNPDWGTSLTYAYELRWADADEFTYLDFSKHSLDWELYWQVLRRVRLGWYLRGDQYDFDTDERADRDIYEGGLTLSVTDAFGIEGLTYSMNGGYEILEISSEDDTGDDDDGFTANFSTRYAPEGILPDHRVRLSWRRNHEDPNPAVNYADEFLAGYGIDMRPIPDWVFTADVDWLDISESDGGEKYNMWRFWVTGTYWLNTKTSCNVGYWFTRRMGTESADYEQNTLELGVTHRF